MGTGTTGSPYVYFGGKARAAPLVWERFGDVPKYIEPFFGSGAVLLANPCEPGYEIANDIDCFVANFWRATVADPDAVVRHADYFVHEIDFHARQRWIHKQDEFKQKMKDDPEYFDAKIAGWWVWGMSSGIGNSWSNPRPCTSIINISTGNGIHKKEIRGPANHQELGAEHCHMLAYFNALKQRLRHVKFCCGDWARCVTPAALASTTSGITGVFLDPPYCSEDRVVTYANDSFDVAHKVREWAIANGNDPGLRIALCGYSGEHDMPEGWETVWWTANGGFGNQSKTKENKNRKRERIWFSKYCLQPGLFS